MDKRQYKQLMEQIQMSNACEQRILNAVHQTKMPQLKKHITWRKRKHRAVQSPFGFRAHRSTANVSFVGHTSMPA